MFSRYHCDKFIQNKMKNKMKIDSQIIYYFMCSSIWNDKYRIFLNLNNVINNLNNVSMKMLYNTFCINVDTGLKNALINDKI